MKNVQEMITMLKAKFPKAWFKDGAEFNDSSSKAIWTGEESYIDKEGIIPMFNYYSERDCYQFGAHVALCKAVEAEGYYVECYDPGTFFIYPD